MSPTFENGDIVLVNRLSYLFEKPKAEDIVIIKREKYIIKRIAKIKKGQIFVLGDNENASTDSRSFGWTDKKEIIGKVIAKI
ncbi:MAG: nickel-type superoxide dismutase maturation protease [Candidatus Levybacteria bacterium RIFCSPLOWO2_02_FULL_36_8b]|nr:MAG: nickel-type superoxide dismutase maturation protease [Candidatus Levybacteria bacterium RIFCSPLOWO2_02_FULL_36_8b]